MGCRNATVLNASADTVWTALRNFHDGSWSANVIEKLTPVGDHGGTEVGASRVLNDAFHETLRELDDANRYFSYSIDDGPGPLAKGQVTGYLGEVTVVPVSAPANSGQCVVVWTSKWESEAGGVHEFCDPIYVALLNDIKAHFG